MNKLILLFILIVSSTSKAQLCFDPAISYNENERPSAITSADFNGDGMLDLAVANAHDSVVILLGNGDGSFNQIAKIKAGTQNISIVSADFNNDNKIDIATSNTATNNIMILLGLGNGTFTTGVNYSVGDPMQIISADFNLDGNADLASVNGTGSSVSVLMGDGSGGFGAVTYFSTYSYPKSLIAGDFNSDSKLDLAVVCDLTLSVLIGDGMGGFSAPTYFYIGTSDRITCYDYNVDGKLDLAITKASIDKIGILLGDGAGNFPQQQNYSVGYNPWYISNGDFDCDGKIDLVTSDWSTISLLLGNGNGTFDSALVSNVGSSSPISIISRDFNYDGKADLAFANTGNYKVSIVLHCVASGTNETSDINQISVYPNPSNTSLSVINIHTKTIIRFYNPLGQLLIEKEVESNTAIDVSILANGLYTIVTDDAKEIKHIKVIISK